MKRISSLLILSALLLPSIAFAQLVNINTANKGELMTLKGIGAVKAQAIIDFRVVRPFYSIEEIMRVKGIGEATFRDLKDFITVGDIAPPPIEATAPKPATSQTPVSVATQNVEPDTSQLAAPAAASTGRPLWWYFAGLLAISGLGIAGVWYTRLSIPTGARETPPSVEEFEILS